MKKQLKKEMYLTILVYVGYFLWWYYFAYIYPPKNPEEYTYILGFPAWFFYSTILGYILLNVVVYLIVKFFFKDVEFEVEHE